MTALACLIATVASYLAARALHRRVRRSWASPLVVAPVVLLAALLASGTPYAVYARDTHWLVWMLGPATVAYAVPIHQRLPLLRRYPVTLASGVVAGVTLGLASSWLLGHAFGLPELLRHSVLPRSVSTPFAVVAAADFGGAPDLAVLCVLSTGVFGMLVGEAVHAWLGLRASLTRGTSFGAAAHAAGTARAYELGGEIGAVSSLTMVLSGIVMVVLAPLLARWPGLL